MNGLSRPGIGWAIVLVLALIVPAFVSKNQYWLSSLILMVIGALNGQAWNIMAGYGGQWSLGQGAFFGLGAYTVGLLFTKLHISPWLGMLAAFAVASAVSVAIGLPTFRLRGHYFSLATIAFTLSLEVLSRHFDKLTGGDYGLSIPLGENWLNMQWRSNVYYYYVGLALLIMGTLATYWLDRSSLGSRLRAIKDDEDAAQAVGVDVRAVKLQAFAISAMLSAAAGVLYVMYLKLIDPASAFGLNLAVQTVLVAISGGIGTVAGPLVGALVIVPLGEWTNATFGASRLLGIQLIVYGAILMLLIALLPTGIAGAWKRISSKRNGRA